MTSLAVTTTPPPRIVVSAPGRICLFGEHQDYLGLPVIAAAIDLRVTLRGRRNDSGVMQIEMPDIKMRLSFDPNRENTYSHGRDYLTAAANVLRRQGLRWSHGYDVTVSSNIPINSGASSSSALQVAWCSLLLAAAGDERAPDPHAVAKLAHASEVAEFRSPGGMMDHFSSALGGLIWLDTRPPYTPVPLAAHVGPFVLVDSGIPKDTNGVLGSARQRAERLCSDFWSLPQDPDEAVRVLSPAKRDAMIARGVLVNRAITVRARRLLEGAFTPAQLGALLDEHHAQLAENVGVSHPRIDTYLDGAREHGALGGKINGSGGGGSFFLLAPEDPEPLRQHFVRQGLRAWTVNVGPGLQLNQSPVLEEVG